MNTTDLEREIRKGEDSFRQFKENFTSIDQLAVEIASFANSSGGSIFIGVTDNGAITGINKADIKRLNQWISNSTSQKVEPPLFVQTEIVEVHDKYILLLSVPRGNNKPYSVNKGEFWVRTGADKRRATRDELYRLMQASSRLYADEMITQQTIDDFDLLYFSVIYRELFEQELDELQISKKRLLDNLKLASGDKLTLAGLLLFGKHIEFSKPQFSIKATCYLSEDNYRDKEDISGKLLEQQKKGVDFILRNLHRTQNEADFNVPGELELPKPAIQEAIANALVHRDYFISASIMINIFPDRVEIISPGVLPNTLTVENIKLGIHIDSTVVSSPNYLKLRDR